MHTFLVKFQCTFHLLKKVRYIIITITVVVCNRQHFLVAIAIIIFINKIINHHNQWNKCQSFVQPSAHPSTHDDASPVSSYIFLEKGNKTTSKFSESFNRIKVKLPPFFLLNFCSTKTRLVQLIRYKTLRIFSAKFWSQLHFFSASFLQITCWKVSIIYFSILVHTSTELSSFPHIDYKSLMLGLHDCRGQTGCVIWSLSEFDLNQIHLKNKIF